MIKMQRNQVATSYYSLQNRKEILYLTQIHDSAATVCTLLGYIISMAPAFSFVAGL